MFPGDSVRYTSIRGKIVHTINRFNKDRILKSGAKIQGGKTKIRDILYRFFPEHNVYYEPFLGSGGVLVGKPKVDVEIVNDLDDLAINFFEYISGHGDRLDPQYFFESLQVERAKIDKVLGNEEEEKKLFHLWRELLTMDAQHGNEILSNSGRALMYYLINKTCRNGIVRFNKRGECNSSFGALGGRGFYTEEWLKAVTARLGDIGRTTFRSKEVGKFFEEDVFQESQKGLKGYYLLKDPKRFMFLDPPYRLKKIEDNKGCVTVYKGRRFTDEDQLKLRDNLKKLDFPWLLTINDDDWIREIYKDYEILPHSVFYSCSNTSAGRSKRPELIIANYPIKGIAEEIQYTLDAEDSRSKRVNEDLDSLLSPGTKN